MANRWAVVNGFADDPATWNGGTLPASTDDLYANNFTVSIRASLTANSLKKIAGSGIVAGGQFVITAAATVTITAGIVAADNGTNASQLVLVDAGSAAVSIVAPGGITGGAGTTRIAVAVSATYSGTLTITANVTGGTASGAWGVSAASASAAVIIDGNVSGGTGGGASVGVGFSSTATCTINGNVTGSTSSASTGYGLYLSGAATVTVTGTVTGGSAHASCWGAYMIAAGTLTIADATASFAAAVRYTANGSVTISGRATAASGVAAVENASPNNVAAITGAAVHSEDGTPPVVGRFVMGSTAVYEARGDGSFPASSPAGTVMPLSLAGPNAPSPGDVRSGVAYGTGGAVMGTLVVPPPGSVASGVPTDDTVGTAALSLADVAALTGAQIAAATSA